MSAQPKAGPPGRPVKIAVSAVIALVLIGFIVFFVVAGSARLGSGPGFLGTRASLFADINLLAQIVLLLGLTVGYAFARQKNIPAHQYNQTAWVLFNIVLTIFIMAVAFSRQVVPGIPARLLRAYYGVSTAHALLGAITILMAVYIVLRMNRLLPKALRISGWKNLMRATLGMYWLVGLFGLGTYYVWYLAPREAAEVPIAQATTEVGAQAGRVVVPLANYAFVPAELTVPVGTTVVFHNVDPDPHTVTFDGGEFPSLGFQEGDMHEMVFDRVGDFQYFCEYHGSPGLKGMSGIIHVVPADQVAAVPTSVPVPTATAQPTPVPLDVKALGVNGGGTFRDAAAQNDSFQVVLSGLPPSSAGEFYAWLTGDATTEPLGLGPVTADAGGRAELLYIAADGQNLLGKYSGFLITLEAAGSSPTRPSADVALGGRIPAGALGPVHQLLVASELGPDHRPYAWALADQAEELTHHGIEVNNAAVAGDRESMNRHIEHLYAIILGANDPQTVDFDGDAFVDNPGDGFGILNYADAIEAQARTAAAATGANDNVRSQAANLQALAQNVRAWSQRLLQLALAAHEARSDADRQAHTAELPALVDRVLNGLDANGNGVIEPVDGEGGARAIYFHSQYMAAMGALTESGLAAVPTAAPATATVEASATVPPAATAGPTPTPGPVIVVFRNFEIVPSQLTIPAGTRVTFEIKDSKHEVYHSFPDSTDIAGFDSGPLNPGQRYTLTFNNPGTITIRCGFHPTKMVMTLTVTP